MLCFSQKARICTKICVWARFVPLGSSPQASPAFIIIQHFPGSFQHCKRGFREIRTLPWSGVHVVGTCCGGSLLSRIFSNPNRLGTPLSEWNNILSILTISLALDVTVVGYCASWRSHFLSVMLSFLLV